MCFLTHVTIDRKPILVRHFDLLWNATEVVRREVPFDLIAWVVLPDHMHLLLNPGASDVSKLMKRIKLSFSTNYRRHHGLREGRVWQYRFWDHIIRDEEDRNRHVDYIHYNPVKHGLTKSPFEWEWSSIRDYREKGYYQLDWGVSQAIRIEGDFGE
jgi:putative transposase